MVLTTLSVAVREVSDALKKSHKVPRFQQRDLPRTVETMFQKLGVEREVRAHLFSHGRTRGVQGQHYERYDLLDEKRRALRKWAAHLERVIEGKPQARVAAIRAAWGNAERRPKALYGRLRFISERINLCASP
jgi:hypothetical protein